MTIDQILEETGQEIRTAASAMAAPELQFENRRPVALRPRRFVLAVASAVFVFIAVGLVAVLVQLDSDGAGVADQADGDSAQPPVATSIDTPTASTVADAESGDDAPAPTDTTEAAAVTMTWTRLDSDVLGGSEQQWIRDIAAGGSGLVAVGADGSGGDLDAAVWYSTDGHTWSKVVHDEAVFGGSGDQYMMAVTAGGPGFVAVGEDTSEDGSSGISAVWISEDGISWSRVPHDEAAFGGTEQTNVFMKDVTVFGSELVAVGVEVTEGSADAVAWISADGISWERVPPDEAVFGGPQFQVMWAVVPAGPGLVAVGQGGDGAGESGPGQPAAVWTSTDGRDWSRVPDQAALLSGYPARGPDNGDWARMDDVIVGGSGLVAVGRVGRCQDFTCTEDAAVWISADGVTWDRSNVEEAVGMNFDRIFGVSSFGDLLVATGVGRAADVQLGPAVVWTSTDGGRTWERVPNAAAFGKLNEGPNAIYASVEFESRLIAVGSWGSDAAIWIATNEE